MAEVIVNALGSSIATRTGTCVTPVMRVTRKAAASGCIALHEFAWPGSVTQGGHPCVMAAAPVTNRSAARHDACDAHDATAGTGGT